MYSLIFFYFSSSLNSMLFCTRHQLWSWVPTDSQYISQTAWSSTPHHKQKPVPLLTGMGGASAVNQDPQTQQQGLRGKSVLCLEFSYQKTHRLAFCSKNQSMKSNSSKRQIKDKCYQSFPAKPLWSKLNALELKLIQLNNKILHWRYIKYLRFVY